MLCRCLALGFESYSRDQGQSQGQEESQGSDGEDYRQGQSQV